MLTYLHAFLTGVGALRLWLFRAAFHLSQALCTNILLVYEKVCACVRTYIHTHIHTYEKKNLINGKKRTVLYTW